MIALFINYKFLITIQVFAWLTVKAIQQRFCLDTNHLAKDHQYTSQLFCCHILSYLILQRVWNNHPMSLVRDGNIVRY